MQKSLTKVCQKVQVFRQNFPLFWHNFNTSLQGNSMYFWIRSPFYSLLFFSPVCTQLMPMLGDGMAVKVATLLPPYYVQIDSNTTSTGDSVRRVLPDKCLPHAGVKKARNKKIGSTGKGDRQKTFYIFVLCANHWPCLGSNNFLGKAEAAMPVPLHNNNKTITTVTGELTHTYRIPLDIWRDVKYIAKHIKC